MTTLTQTPTGPTTSTFPATESTCGCGQALELSHTAHCPRCGTTLRADTTLRAAG